MAKKTNKTQEVVQVEESTSTTKYFFSHNFRDGDMLYLRGVGYELTQEQIKAYSKTVRICDCPEEIAQKWGCWCKK